MIIKTLSLGKTNLGIEHCLELTINGEKIHLRRFGNVSETTKEEIEQCGNIQTLFPKNNFTFFDYLMIVNFLGDSLPDSNFLIGAGFNENNIALYNAISKSMFKL